MSVDGSLIFDTRIDTKGFSKGTNTLKKQANGLSSTFAKLGVAIGVAYIGKKLVQAGKEAVKFASDLQEVQNVVDTAFGDMAYKMEEFANIALESYGISKLTAKEMGSVFMAMGKGIGQASDIASDKAIEMTGRMADIMSFYNKTASEVDTIGRAVYSGETEPLKQIGIIMTETNLNAYTLAKGYDNLYKQMSAGDKLLVRQAYFLEQTSLAAGDFANTSNSWANQTRILTERWKEFLGIIGNGLIQVLAPAVKFLNTALSYMIEFARATGQVLSDVFGFEQVATSTSKATENISSMGDAVEDTSKQISKSLSPIDELNVVSGSVAQSSGDAASAMADIGSSVGGSGTSEKNSSPLQEGIKQSLLEIGEVIAPTTKKIKDLFNAIKEASIPAGDALKIFYNETLKPFAKWTFSEALPEFLGLMEDEVRLAGSAIEKANPAFQSFLKTINPVIDLSKNTIIALLKNLREIVKDVEDTVKKSSAFKDLKDIFDKLSPIVSIVCKALEQLLDLIINAAKGQVIDLFNAKWRDLESVLGIISDLLKGDFKGALKGVYDLMIGNKIEFWKDKWNDLKGVLAKLKDEFPQIKEKASSAINGIKTVWNEKIPNWFENDVKPMFSKEKWSSLYVNISTQLSEAVKKFGTSFSTGMKNVWKDSISPWFTLKKWSDLGANMKNGLYSGFKGIVYKIVDIINAIISTIEGMFNGIIDIINKVLEGYNKVPLAKDVSLLNKVSYQKVKYPKLATGTVVPANFGEFQAILGDNKREPEVVSPVSTMKQAFLEAMAESGGNGTPLQLIVQVGRRTIMDETIRANKENQDAGRLHFVTA